MFELLGFDRFELIGELLANRSKLINATFEAATEIAVSKAGGMMPIIYIL